MGRSRAFVETDVVRAARDVFWDRGYAEASVPELEAATGLARSSIYHGFGSKRGLFDAAVTSYLDDVVYPSLAALRGDPVAAEALEQYLSRLRAAMSDPATPLSAHGCLLLNAATAAGQDEELRSVVRASREALSDAIHAGVAARRPDLPAEATRILAASCTAHVVTSMTLVRADRDAAITFLDDALALVRG